MEHELFGRDGFDEYEQRMTTIEQRIEQRLGLANLGHYTALPPPT